MEFPGHTNESAKLLQECQQSLLNALDQYHVAMQEKIQDVYGPPFMEKLMASLEQQKHVHPQTHVHTMNESQWSLEQQLTQMREREQEESIGNDPHLETSSFGSSTGPTSRFESAGLDVQTRTSKVSKYHRSTELKQKIKDVEKLATPQETIVHHDSIRDKLAHWMQSVFDRVLGFLILASTVLTFAQLHDQSQEVRESLGLETMSWAHANLIFSVLAYFFCAVFLTELALRVYVERLAFFRNCFNLLDLIVVPLMAMDAVLGNIGLDLSIARTVRVLRVIRSIQLVRSLAHFRHLRILWNTIAASVEPFIYSMTIMFVFMVMLAILLAQTLQHFSLDESNNMAHRQWVYKHYGDGLKSIWTVFELTFSGCWPTYVRPLVEHVSAVYAPIFAVYVTVVIFAMSRIISAMLLKETLQQASSDTEMMVRDRAKATGNMEKNLIALFRTADVDNDGLLTEEEFSAILSHENIQLWLGMLGIDGNDASGLYKQLGGDVEGLPCDSFVYNVKRLKGEARAQDLIPLVNDCKQILRLCEESRNAWSNIHCKLRTQLPQVGGHHFARDNI